MALISVILPCHNEEDVVSAMFQKLVGVTKNLPNDNFEFIFVDDGSTDTTFTELRKIHQIDRRVVLVRLTTNFGHQKALIAGMSQSSGDAIITMDADLQHPPELIGLLITKWSEGYEVVTCKRTSDTDASLFKRVFSTGFYWLISCLSNIIIPASASDFRLVSRRVMNYLIAYNTHSPFLRGMVAQLGFRSFIVEFRPDARVAGRPSYSFRRSLMLAIDGVTGLSIAPLRLAFGIGFFTTVCSVFFGLYWIYRKFVSQVEITGGLTDIFLLLIFLGGIQLMFLGVLGEYIGRIFTHGLGRPPYVIDEIIKTDLTDA